MAFEQVPAHHRRRVVRREKLPVVFQHAQPVFGDAAVGGERADHIDLPVGDRLVHQARVQVDG